MSLRKWTDPSQKAKLAPPRWSLEAANKPADRAEAVVEHLSKDDLFFAVQAVDRDGNASLPTLPVPPPIRPTRAARE